MKFNIKAILLIIASAYISAPIHAAVLTMKDEYIKSISPEELYKRISNAKRTGSTIQGESPETTARLQLIYNAVGQNTDYWLSATRALQASVGTPMGTGQTPYDASIAAQLEQLRLENEQLRKSMGTGAQGQTGVSTDTGIPTSPMSPEFDGGTGAPPPPPPPPGTPPPPPFPVSGTEPTAPKATKAPVSVQLVLDQTNETLNDDQKRKSNACVIEALKIIALELFIETTKIDAILTSGLKAPLFKNSFETYQFFIKDRLAALVGLNNAFKKRSILAAMIGKNSADQGTLFTFINQEFKASGTPGYFDSSLETFYKEFNETEGLAPLLAQYINSLMFEEIAITEYQQYIDTIASNLVVSQRPRIDSSKISLIAKIRSDDLVDAILRTMIAKAIKDGVTLSQDYIEWFYDEINRVRMAPIFLKYDGLIGSEARMAAQASKSPIEKETKYPLLEVLLSPKQNNLTLQKFIFFINAQLVFDAASVSDIFTDKTAADTINKILTDHLAHLQAAGANVDINMFIADYIATAKTIKNLQDLATKLDAFIPASDNNLKTLKNQLKELEPSIPAVVNALNALSKVPQPAYSENTVIQILTDYASQNQIKKTAVDALNAIKAHYASAKKQIEDQQIALGKKRAQLTVIAPPIDQFVYQQIIDHNIAAKFKFEQKFNALDRIADDIPPFFNSVLGADVTSKIIPKNLWYNIVNSYGLVTKVLQEVPNETISSDESALDLLINSLEALNTGTIIMNKHYVPCIKNNASLIQSKVLAGTLTEVIDALYTYDIAQCTTKIAAFFQNANAKIDLNSDAYAQMILKLLTYLTTAIMSDIVQEMNSINDGTVENPLKDLPLDEVPKQEIVRNAAIYAVMKNQLSPLLKFITKNRAPLSTISDILNLNLNGFDTEKLNVVQQFKEQLQRAKIKYLSTTEVETQQETIVKLFSQYIDSVREQLEYLKKSASLVKDGNKSQQPDIIIDAIEANGPPPPPPPPPPM